MKEKQKGKSQKSQNMFLFVCFFKYNNNSGVFFEEAESCLQMFTAHSN